MEQKFNWENDRPPKNSRWIKIITLICIIEAISFALTRTTAAPTIFTLIFVVWWYQVQTDKIILSDTMKVCIIGLAFYILYLLIQYLDK